MGKREGLVFLAGGSGGRKEWLRPRTVYESDSLGFMPCQLLTVALSK